MKNDMPDELKHEPERIFCEQVNIFQTSEMFFFWMRSGGKLHAYAMTPDHAKQIYNLLQRKIADYENENRIILEGRLPNDPMKSPIQFNERPPENGLGKL